MSAPVVTIVGRPNVGKSTLFNRIVGERKAIVSPVPGVTRDRNIEHAEWTGRPFLLVDTGGFEPKSPEPLWALMRLQAQLAIEEADLIVLVLDGRAGLVADDYELCEILRKGGRPLIVAVNKVDSARDAEALAEFWQLGIEPMVAVSAEHGHGVAELLDQVVERLPAPEEESDAEEDEKRIRIAIVGRPNVGKSSLVNRLLDEPRVIVSEIPGTTRDAIDTPLTAAGRDFLLIDTAGIRRRGRVEQHLEKLSVLKALKAIERAHVVLLVVDAQQGIVEQDVRIAGLVHEGGRACVWIVNKWDLVEKDDKTLGRFAETIRDRARFHDYVPVEFVSAQTGQRLHKLLPRAAEVFDRASARIGTASLNEALEQAFARHQPPTHQGKPAKLLYATQVRVRPPSFVLFLDHPEALDLSYQRYLENRLREAFDLEGVPVRIRLRKRRKKGERL
jgi:GTP-binding protein